MVQHYTMKLVKTLNQSSCMIPPSFFNVIFPIGFTIVPHDGNFKADGNFEAGNVVHIKLAHNGTAKGRLIDLKQQLVLRLQMLESDNF